MSILHRRRLARDLNAERAAGGKRKSRPHQVDRASKRKPRPADLKPRTSLDPEAAPPAAPVAVPKRKRSSRR